MSNEIMPTNHQVDTIENYTKGLQEKLNFAQLMLNTKMVPAHFKSPADILAAILYGQELGFSPMQSLQSVTVIQGKPALDAYSLKAKILQAGGIIKTIRWDNQICELKGVRGDWEEIVNYTIEDARIAGLAGKDNWKRMPKEMLYARAVSKLGRNQWADVLKGFYTKEEMQDVSGGNSDNVPAPILTTVAPIVLNVQEKQDEVALPYTYCFLGATKTDKELAKKEIVEMKHVIEENGVKKLVKTEKKLSEKWDAYILDFPETTFNNDELPDSFHQAKINNETINLKTGEVVE